MRSKSRREFLTAAVASAAVFGVKPDLPSFSASPGGVNALAINGGTPLRTAAFPDWPKITDDDEKSWNAVLRKKMWCRL